MDLAADANNTLNNLSVDEATFPSQSPSQCAMGVTSSFPISEIEDFFNPFSASVEEGLGAGVVVAGRSSGALVLGCGNLAPLLYLNGVLFDLKRSMGSEPSSWFSF